MTKTKNTRPAKTADQKKSEALESYLADYNSANDYVRINYHPLWRECYRLYRNKRVKIGYEGYSDAFIPETHTIIESLVSNIAGGKPKFQYFPTTEEQDQETDTLNQLVDYIWEANHMNLVSQVWVREMLQYGTGVLHVGWDPVLNLPSIKNIPIYDFVFDPTAVNRESARFMGFRYLANRKDLKDAKTVDPETGDLVDMYDMSGLDKDDSGHSQELGDQMDKTIKDMLMGTTVPNSANEDQVEVICLYYKDGKKVEIANRTCTIYDKPSPFQREESEVMAEVMVDGMLQETPRTISAIDPFFPFAVLRDYVDPSLFLGNGEIEVIMYRQETLNDIENMDLDNAAYANNIMWQIDPQYADLMPEITAAPGLVVPIPQGALRPIERPSTTADLDNMKNYVQEQMRRATAADEVIQGASQQQGRITATEVQTQMNQSMTRFSTKINNLESEGFAQLGDILVKVCQIFITQKQAIRIVGEEGISWKDYDPYEYTGQYEPHVKLESTLKSQSLEEGQKLNQMYQLLLNNPYINQPEALRFIFKNMGADNEDINKLLTQPPQMPMTPGMMPPGPVDPAMAAMGGMPPMMGAPVGI